MVDNDPKYIEDVADAILSTSEAEIQEELDSFEGFQEFSRGRFNNNNDENE